MTRPLFPVEDRRRTHEDPNIPTLTFSAPHHPLFLFRGIDKRFLCEPIRDAGIEFLSGPDNLAFSQVPGTALPTATTGSNCSTIIQYLNRAVVLYCAIPAWKSTVPRPYFHNRGTTASAANNNGGERGVPQCRRIWGTAPATHHDRSLEVISLALQPTRFHVLFCSPVVGLSLALHSLLTPTSLACLCLSVQCHFSRPRWPKAN